MMFSRITAATAVAALMSMVPPAAADDPADVADPWEMAPQPVEHPQLFGAPTARLIPAGVLYGSVGIDSDGIPSAGLTLGLGDVAEFGVSTTDIVRARPMPDEAAESILPYVTATFRI